MVAGNIKKGVKIFGVTGTWTGPVDSNVTLSVYYSPTVQNTSKIYRSANYEGDDSNPLLEFSGTIAQHIALEEKLWAKGYTTLWIEANFNYYTHATNNSNRVYVRFLGRKPDGTDHMQAGDPNGVAYLTKTGSVQNVWAMLHMNMYDDGYDPAAYYVYPRVYVWFARASSSHSDWNSSDWFQMTKWACWFSKS